MKEIEFALWKIVSPGVQDMVERVVNGDTPMRALDYSLGALLDANEKNPIPTHIGNLSKTVSRRKTCIMKDCCPLILISYTIIQPPQSRDGNPPPRPS